MSKCVFLSSFGLVSLRRENEELYAALSKDVGVEWVCIGQVFHERDVTLSKTCLSRMRCHVFITRCSFFSLSTVLIGTG